MATYFEKLFRDAEDLLFVPGDELKRLNRDKSGLKDYMNRPMQINEKKILAANLRKLPKDDLKRAQQIIFGRMTGNLTSVNIAKLSTKTCRDLEKLVKLSYQAQLHTHRQLKNHKKFNPSDDIPHKRLKRSQYNEC